MKPKICITEKEFYKAETVFRKTDAFKCIPVLAQEDILAKAIIDKNAFAAVLGVEAFVEQLYSALPKGGIIARFGVGHDGLDKQKATAAGLIVTNTPGVLDDSVAEHAIWLMGALARQVAVHDNNMKSQKWQPSSGIELKEKTLLILGCGNIGRKVAKIASFGLRMNVIAYDVVKLDAEQMKSQFGISRLLSNLDEAVAQADFISVHLPANKATKHFIGKDFLGKMRRDSFVINTSRGSIVDESALYDFLESGKIAGAGLDIFEKEPYMPVEVNKDLRELPRILLTPHIASSTVEACERMAKSCLRNIKAAFDKRYNELDIVNSDVLKELSNEQS